MSCHVVVLFCDRWSQHGLHSAVKENGMQFLLLIIRIRILMIHIFLKCCMAIAFEALAYIRICYLRLSVFLCNQVFFIFMLLLKIAL